MKKIIPVFTLALCSMTTSNAINTSPTTCTTLNDALSVSSEALTCVKNYLAIPYTERCRKGAYACIKTISDLTTQFLTAKDYTKEAFNDLPEGFFKMMVRYTFYAIETKYIDLYTIDKIFYSLVNQNTCQSRVHLSTGTNPSTTSKFISQNILPGIVEWLLINNDITPITELFLHDNDLTKLPIALAQLTSLKQLHCNFNAFTSIPQEILNMPKLTFLSLIHNTPKLMLTDTSEILKRPGLNDLTIRGCWY